MLIPKCHKEWAKEDHLKKQLLLLTFYAELGIILYMCVCIFFFSWCSHNIKLIMLKWTVQWYFSTFTSNHYTHYWYGWLSSRILLLAFWFSSVFMPLFLFGLWRKNIPFLALYSNHLSGDVLILCDFFKFMYLFTFKHLFIWLCQVLVVACGI